MSVIEAIILGIVQGLTEFLPVSSSGHLVLLQRIFGIELPGLFFDTMLHLGTLAAVFAALWKDIWELLRKPFQKLTLFLILGTIPAVIAALVFGGTIEKLFDTAKLLGVSFLITTVLLVTAELLSRRPLKSEDTKTKDNMKWYDALFIGIMQAIAIPPGISRSGATISGALFRRFDRSLAARFSFLLSIPAILGAVVLHSRDIVTGTVAIEEISIIAVIIGTLTAAVVGYFAVRFMLKIIREKSLFGFAIYTGVLGILVLLDQFVTQIVFYQY
ncbi:MAG: undecaprenyl-diphosphate phosphatase [Treponema sp.]|nr:undecaprenyl-diphosphate phosphatase [Treponema sp.]